MNALPGISRRAALKLGAAATSSLFLPPVARADSFFTFFVIGDWGAPEKHQKDVAHAMAVEADQQQPRLIVSVGDNFYPNGVASVTDQQWKNAFEDMYNAPSLNHQWYAVLGNHDEQGSSEAEFAYQQVDSRWHMPSRYYTHVEPVSEGVEAQFFFLDTNGHGSGDEETALGLDRAQFEWLERELTRSTAKWRFVAGHHPVFSGGHHGSSPPLIRRLKPLLDRHKVQVYFCGHDHNMQHLKIDNVHYIVAGSGSATRSTSKIKGSIFAAAELGFLRAKLFADKLEVSWIGVDQAVLHAAIIPIG
jgi:tartrate-resistant acid phosphatase type 5